MAADQAPTGARLAGRCMLLGIVAFVVLFPVYTTVIGALKPSGKLPFALPGNTQAVVGQASDAPGYDRADTLFPFGFGLSY